MSRSFRESELQELETRERPGYKPRPGYLRYKKTENVVKDLNLTLDTGQFRLIFRRGNLSLRLKRILIASSATKAFCNLICFVPKGVTQRGTMISSRLYITNVMLLRCPYVLLSAVYRFRSFSDSPRPAFDACV